jgi:two-component system, chemotaxis family, protein-glutamate methylesterase/glutaminase
MTPAGDRLRVLVVARDGRIREAWGRALAGVPGIEIVGYTDLARALPARAAVVRPQCVLVDLLADPKDGFEALAAAAELDGPLLRVAVAAQHDLGGGRRRHRRQHGWADGARGVASLAPLAVKPFPPAQVVLRRDGEEAANVNWPELVAALTAALAGWRERKVVPARIGAAAASAPGTRSAPAVVGIGVSTGGPMALAALLPRLPKDFPLPVLVVQHMPAKFTASLAASLDKVCQLRVAEARDGERLEAGRILIAPGGQQMRVNKFGGTSLVRITDDAPELSCKPSVDYLFRSLATVHGSGALGVVLTGMGEDGWAGCRLLAAVGAQVLAQDEASCIVYGMPRGPIEAGHARAVPLDGMAKAILQWCGGVPCS